MPPATIRLPALLAQGLADPLVTPAAQEAFVDTQIVAGIQIDYREYEGLGHVELVEANSPAIADLITWTKALFTNK